MKNLAVIIPFYNEKDFLEISAQKSDRFKHLRSDNTYR